MIYSRELSVLLLLWNQENLSLPQGLWPSCTSRLSSFHLCTRAAEASTWFS